MNKRYFEARKYIGFAHIVDINNPRYDELWYHFYQYVPNKEIKSVLSIQRTDANLDDKLLFVTMVEVDTFDGYDEDLYRYELKAGDYLVFESNLARDNELPDIIAKAYNHEQYKVDRSEIIELFENDDFDLAKPTSSFLFKIID